MMTELAMGARLEREPSQGAEPENEGLGIKKVAVIGGGTTGVGIARSIAGAGIEVFICEKDEPSWRDSRRALEEELDEEVARWSLTSSEKESLLHRVSGGWKIWDASHADLVIESVTEDFQVKRALFVKLDEICDPQIVFVTNTATLSVSELGAVTNRADRFVGMHFVSPVPRTKVAEIVRGLATSDRTVNLAKQFAGIIGKTPIEVFEYPGYVTTRLIVPLINEAIYVVMEGVASAEDVDTAMKLGYQLETGPLALADHMGLDVVMSWMEHLFRELGELKYRPCPLLRKMVRAGRLGVKTGEGFFQYDKKV
jgi:3-hydroxybutyryl-CoA dehydrogenase